MKMLKFSQRNYISLIAIAIVIANCLTVQGVLRLNLKSRIRNILNPPHYERTRKVSPYLNVSQYPGEQCNRVCREGHYRICYFEFTLEFYHAMGVACGNCAQGVEADCNNPQCIVGDGFQKGVMSINRQSPGPDIQVCKDDIIIVDVHNRAEGTTASIHWHGLHMIDTPYMDGVPFVTQCPIPFASTFRYQFRATEAGTQFYHSHSGHHKANGQYGAIIVREPPTMDISKSFYDLDLPEHKVFVADWMHRYAEQFFPGLATPAGVYPDAFTINGRGVFTNLETQERTTVRPTIYYVQPRRRYRFRFINGLSHACPIQMQIESHVFHIIATDSFPVSPQTFDTLISNSGERFDFILNANQIPGDFWLRVRGLGLCGDRRIESYALIRYVTSDNIGNQNNLQIPPFPSYDVPYPSIRILNHPNATCFTSTRNKCVTELTAVEDDEELRSAEPDHKFFLAFKNYEIPSRELFRPGRYDHFANLISNVTVIGGINNISLSFPDYSLLTQPHLIDESQFCDTYNLPARCANERLCHCLHRLKVRLNSIIELIVVDGTETINDVNHPFHLHGYRFMVIGMGQDPSGLHMNVRRAQELESKKLLLRAQVNPNLPYKDTVSIPSRGYAILRVRATNPGFWLMHCHYEWHSSIGMSLVLQVGEVSDMVDAPEGFPQCGNYAPPVRRRG